MLLKPCELILWEFKRGVSIPSSSVARIMEVFSLVVTSQPIMLPSAGVTRTMGVGGCVRKSSIRVS